MCKIVMIAIAIILVLAVIGAIIYIIIYTTKDNFKQEPNKQVSKQVINKPKQVPVKETYNNFNVPTEYHLNNGDVGNLFEVTPEKKCRLYPYLYSEECEQLAKMGKLKNNPYFCDGGNADDLPSAVYKGWKGHFEYTPESDAAWKWTRCQQSVGNMIPQVL